MMLCRMDDRIGKRSTKGLRIDVQQMMINIHAGRVEKRHLSGVFLLFANEECGRLILFSSSLLSDLTIIKWRRDRRKLSHDSNTISVLMSLSRKVKVSCRILVKMLTM
jgi:hypothetical protein